MSHNRAIPCEKEYEISVVDTVVRKYRTRAAREQEAQKQVEKLVECSTELPAGELIDRAYDVEAVRDGSETMIDFDVRVSGEVYWWFACQRLNVAGAFDGRESTAAADDFRKRIIRGDVTPRGSSISFGIDVYARQYRGVSGTLNPRDDVAFQRIMLTALRESIDKELQTLDASGANKTYVERFGNEKD